jgi:WD40 repeat protein
VAWSPTSLRLASGSYDRTVLVWDVPDSGQVVAYKRHTDGVYGVAWSPDGKYIASASDDKTVQVWDAAAGRHPYTYTGHTDKVYGVVWSPDGKRLASGGADIPSHSPFSPVRQSRGNATPFRQAGTQCAQARSLPVRLPNRTCTIVRVREDKSNGSAVETCLPTARPLSAGER